ncbi:hypothetical protein AB1N83_014324, partial [Pleurotus pulmonarius]
DDAACGHGAKLLGVGVRISATAPSRSITQSRGPRACSERASLRQSVSQSSGRRLRGTSPLAMLQAVSHVPGVCGHLNQSPARSSVWFTSMDSKRVSASRLVVSGLGFTEASHAQPTARDAAGSLSPALSISLSQSSKTTRVQAPLRRRERLLRRSNTTPHYGQSVSRVSRRLVKIFNGGGADSVSRARNGLPGHSCRPRPGQRQQPSHPRWR